jgi:hypothetical protein
MTYTHNPLGFCVLSSVDPDADLAYWQRLRPHAMLFTQDVFALAKAAQDTIPELKVCIMRTVDKTRENTVHHGGKPGMDSVLQDFCGLVEYQHLDKERTYLHVFNEPDLNSGETEGLLKWTVELMSLARTYGVHCVVLNAALATLSKERVQSGLFDNLLRELADGYHAFGIHEHSGPIPPAGCAGRVPDMYLDKPLTQQEYWPSPYDVQVGSVDGNWHIGRLYWWLQRCNQLGIPHPRIIVTEFGNDRMGDLEHVKLVDGQIVNIYQELETRYAREEFHDGQFMMLKVPWPHETMYGVDTLKWVWKDYYPLWTFARTHMEFIQWQLWIYCDWQTGKPHIEAALEFAHCPGHDEWDRKNGSHATADPEYRLLTIGYASDILDTPDPEPEPEPDPDEPPPIVPVSTAWLLAGGLCAALIILILGTILLLSHKSTGVTHMEFAQLTTPNEAGQMLLSLIITIVNGGMASIVVEPVVNVLKLVLPKVSSKLLLTFVAALVTVAYWVAQYAGVDIEQIAPFEKAIVAVANVILTFVTVFVAPQGLYRLALAAKARNIGVPGTAHQRSK